MPRTTRATRLAAGALVLALPLAAAAGCGAEKKRSIKAELSSAQDNLESSKAATVTLRFDDTQGSLAKLMTEGEDPAPKAVADAVLKGSVSWTFDPAGEKTFKQASADTSEKDLSKQLEKVNLSLLVRDDKADLGELRLVAGVLYLHVDLEEVGRLAALGGVKDFDSQLDDAVESADPTFRQGLTDLRAGKWVQLPITKYLKQLQDLAGSFAPGATATPPPGYDSKALGNRLYAAVKPYVTVTDANDSSSDRVLDVNVKARPALKAALSVLQAEKDLPFLAPLKGVTPADIDEKVADGTAKGTIRLSDGHLKQVAVDLGSLGTLAKDDNGKKLAGSKVVLDVDDDADEVKAPTDVSSFDLGKVLEDFLGSFGAQTDSASSSYTG